MMSRSDRESLEEYDAQRAAERRRQLAFRRHRVANILGREEGGSAPPPPPQRATEGTEARLHYQSLLAMKRRMDPENEYIGESLPILELFGEIETYNRSPDKPILIQGPSGAGKT